MVPGVAQLPETGRPKPRTRSRETAVTADIMLQRLGPCGQITGQSTSQKVCDADDGFDYAR